MNNTVIDELSNIVASNPAAVAKVERLVNRDSVRTYTADSDTFYANSRILEHLDPRRFEMLYADLNFFKLVPIINNTPLGAESIKYTVYDTFGVAKAMAEHANDIPLINAVSKTYEHKIINYNIGYLVSREDMYRSEMSGINKVSELQIMAARAHLEAMNKGGFFGDTVYGVNGWLTNAEIDKQVVADGTGGKTWATKTGDEIVADIAEPMKSIIKTTRGIEAAAVLLIPKDIYVTLQTKRMPNTDRSVLEYVQSKIRLDIIPIHELMDAFSHNNQPASGFVLYEKNEMKMWTDIPVMYALDTPIQQARGGYLQTSFSYFGGCINKNPKGQAIRYGI